MGIEFLDLVEGVERVGIINVIILFIVMATGYFVFDTIKKAKEEELKQKQKMLSATEENARVTAESIREVKDMVFAINLTLADLQASTRESLDFMREIIINQRNE